jgi:hypothetical protein
MFTSANELKCCVMTSRGISVSQHFFEAVERLDNFAFFAQDDGVVALAS